MNIITALAVFWLLVGLSGLYAWTRSVIESFRNRAAQRRAGENGVLEAIANEAITRDVLGAIVAGLNVGAAFAVVAFEDTSDVRAAITRIALTLAMLACNIMGVHGRVTREQIGHTIRRLKAEAAREA